MSSYPPPTPPPYGPDLGVPKKKKGMGCFAIGLIVVALTLFLGVGGLFLLARTTIRSYVNTYTETAPRPLPKSNLPEEEAKEAVARFEEFKATADAAAAAANAEDAAAEPPSDAEMAARAEGAPEDSAPTAPAEPEPAAEAPAPVEVADATAPAEAAFEGTPRNEISLTADEINAILERAPEFKELSSSVRVRIEGDSLVGIMSLPLDEVLEGKQLPSAVKFFTGDLSGRYVNGEARIRMEARDGRVELGMESLEVAGNAAPPEYLKGFNESLQRGADSPRDPSLRRLRGEVDSLEIADGRLTIRLRE